MTRQMLPLGDELIKRTPSSGTATLFASETFVKDAGLALGDPGTVVFMRRSRDVAPLCGFSCRGATDPKREAPFSSIELVESLKVLRASRSRDCRLSRVSGRLDGALIGG